VPGPPVGSHMHVAAPCICTVECLKMPRPLTVKSAQRLYGRGWCNMHSTLVCVETTFSLSFSVSGKAHCDKDAHCRAHSVKALEALCP
jgi:hypothetical protein